MQTTQTLMPLTMTSRDSQALTLRQSTKRNKSKRSKNPTQQASVENKVEGFNRIKLLETYVDPKLKIKDEENAFFRKQWRDRKHLTSSKRLIS